LGIRTVYVVDDDSMIRRSTVFFLSAAGYVARASISGKDFLDEVETLAPGCVLLDIRMPDIDGLQVIEALGERLVQLPVVVMTGHGDVATAVRAMKLGASDFLEKPFDEDTLLATLERTFDILEDHVSFGNKRSDAQALLDKLTQREGDVLSGLVAGLSNKALAFQLDLSVRTVEMHRANMMDRLGVKTFPEAVRVAFHAGLIP